MAAGDTTTPPAPAPADDQAPEQEESDGRQLRGVLDQQARHDAALRTLEADLGIDLGLNRGTNAAAKVAQPEAPRLPEVPLPPPAPAPRGWSFDSFLSEELGL